MTAKTMSVVLVACLLGLTASACSGSGDDPKADGTSASPTSGESVDPARVSPSLKALPEVKGRKGAIGDLTIDDCDTAAGKQKVSGSITSSANKVTDYLVSVSWTTAAGDVMGQGFKVLKKVAPGDTAEFTIKTQVADGATQCVNGAERGKIA